MDWLVPRGWAQLYHDHPLLPEIVSSPGLGSSAFFWMSLSSPNTPPPPAFCPLKRVFSRLSLWPLMPVCVRWLKLPFFPQLSSKHSVLFLCQVPDEVLVLLRHGACSWALTDQRETDIWQIGAPNCYRCHNKETQRKDWLVLWEGRTFGKA